MSTTTLRPNATVANGTSTIGGGAASRHAALSDNSDTTYVDVAGNVLANTAMSIGFAEPSLTAGSVILAGYLRIRAKAASGTSASSGQSLTLDGGDGAAANAVPVTGVIQTATVLYAGGDGSDLIAAFWRVGSVSVRLYEAYIDVRYVTPPTVTVGAPTGTLTETNRPTVSFTPTYDADSPGQYGYEVKVFDDATYGGGGFDPDTSTPTAMAVRPESRSDNYSPSAPVYPLGTATSWDVDESLPNDTYRAYVRVANLVGGEVQWSDWAYSGFIVNVTPPDPPAVVLTDQPSDLRIKVDVTPDNSPIATDGFIVQRSVDGGTTWELVEAVLSGSPSTIYSYRFQSGAEVSYRAAGWNDTASGRLYSAWTTATVTPTANWRIIHPTDPTLSFAIEDRPDSWMRSQPSISKPARVSFNQPLSRTDTVGTQDTPGPDSGQITFASKFAKLSDLDTLLASGAPALLLAGRAQDGWRDRWVVFGDREDARIVDQSFVDLFDVTLAWTEVAEP